MSTTRKLSYSFLAAVSAQRGEPWGQGRFGLGLASADSSTAAPELCRSCYFSFEECMDGILRSGDASLCTFCAENGMPPKCQRCRKHMISDAQDHLHDHPEYVVIHDLCGSSMMYGGVCRHC